MPRRSLASAALSCAADAFRSLASAAHSCARHLSATAGDVSIALPKFLVTTVAPKSQVGDKIVFDSKSPEASGELPVFLVDVKYEDNASVAGKWTQAEPRDEGKGKNWTVDKHGKGKFSGTAVSQVSSVSLAPET